MNAEKSSENEERPHVFISYGWSSLDHQQTVEKLAQDLTDSNIHVVLDLWDLQTSDDTLTFMERSVNDPKIKKVLILADKYYVEKANNRQGGVGTETQIISPSIYNTSNPGKFAVIVYERDENGKPYLPTYYKSKMYIDFSDSSRYAEEFEKLQRWIFDKPAYVRPAYGVTPSFVSKPNAISLGTDTQARRVLDALNQGKSTALGAFTDYLETCLLNLERFRITRSSSEEFDDQVVASIDALKPFKDQLLSTVNAAIIHTDSKEYGVRLHSFFENFYGFTKRPINFIGGSYESDFDNFAFVMHETFLSCCALLLKKKRFDLLLDLIAVDYFLPESFSGSRVLSTHEKFSTNEIISLQERKRRLSSKKISLQAEMLLSRTKDSLLIEEDLIQTDFLLFMRSKLNDGHWFPATYMYASQHRAFEIFARSASQSFFSKIQPVLGVTSLEGFKTFMENFKGQRAYGGSFAASYETLVGLRELGTRP